MATCEFDDEAGATVMLAAAVADGFFSDGRGFGQSTS